MAQEDQQKEILDLTEVYEIIKHDAKLLVSDLLEGISMWRQAAFLMVVLAVLGFYLAIIALYPNIPSSLSFISHMIQAFSALVLGIFTSGAALYYVRRYFHLKKKYNALYEAAKRTIMYLRGALFKKNLR